MYDSQERMMKKMKFINHEHQKFYQETMINVGIDDTYHKALFYTLGIDQDCRSHIHDLYDFQNYRIRLGRQQALCNVNCLALIYIMDMSIKKSIRNQHHITYFQVNIVYIL